MSMAGMLSAVTERYFPQNYKLKSQICSNWENLAFNGVFLLETQRNKRRSKDSNHKGMMKNLKSKTKGGAAWR